MSSHEDYEKEVKKQIKIIARNCKEFLEHDCSVVQGKRTKLELIEYLIIEFAKEWVAYEFALKRLRKYEPNTCIICGKPIHKEEEEEND